MSRSLKNTVLAHAPWLVPAFAAVLAFGFYVSQQGADSELKGITDYIDAVESESRVSGGGDESSLSSLNSGSILPPSSPFDANGYLARVMLDSPEEVEKALLRAEELYRQGKVAEGENPLAFVLHGPEVEIFFKENYAQYKSIVDLAARLSAFKVVDVKVCRTRLGVLGENEQALVPFVETVRFGPAEIDRLLTEEEYVYF